MNIFARHITNILFKQIIMKHLTLLLLLLISTISLSQSNLSYYLPDDVTYDSTIPTPESIIGHEVGEWHISHDKLSQYMEILASKSDRISIENRGVTYEGRPLLLLTITSTENHSNIEEIRKNHVSLSSSEGASKSVENMPIVVYQGFSIHGNEPSGSNASLLLAYYLAAAQGPNIDTLLNNAVILLDPSLNPDGLQRFSHWANVNKSVYLNSDKNEREFHETWPGGRTNHYWFDMNRDWLPVQLPESQARIASFVKWLPNILTDHHEMGTNATFFFQPGIPSRTHPLTPKMNQKLTGEIANFHAEAFDKIGSLYYTQESFDDFYYGKGSTYPDINGSIGILFEQASSRGHLQESANGDLSFPFTIRNQFTASLSTLEAAKNLRVKILNYYKKFYADARKEALKDPYKGIVFGDSKDKSINHEFIKLLKTHDIKVHKLSSSVKRNGITFSKNNGYIIPLEQKKYRLIKAMFDIRTKFKDSLFYDVSAWTLPYAFNIPFHFAQTTNFIGEEITENKVFSKDLEKSEYAYLFEAHNYNTPKLVHTLLDKGIRVKVGLKQFTLKGKKFDYGTYLIPSKNQKIDSDSLYKLLSKLNSKTSISISSVSTGLTEKGIDLGSNNFLTLRQPKVAMLVGNGIRSYDAGEIWHLMDTRYQIPVTKIDISYLSSIDLSKYSHFIIPSAGASSLNPYKEKLKNWTKSGGVLVGYRNTINWLSKNEFIKSTTIKEKEKREAKNISFEDKQNYNGAQYIGGAIFQTKIDRSHPLNFGITSNKLPIFRNSTIFLEPKKNSYDNPIQYTNTPLLSGYISKENLKMLKNTVPITINNLGKGKVICLTDNTNFRAFWFGTNKLFANILFYASMM